MAIGWTVAKGGGAGGCGGEAGRTLQSTGQDRCVEAALGQGTGIYGRKEQPYWGGGPSDEGALDAAGSQSLQEADGHGLGLRRIQFQGLSRRSLSGSQLV